MRFEIFPDLYDIRLVNEEKRIWSPTFLLLITKNHNFQILDNICALQRGFCDLYRFLRSTVLMGGHLNFDGHKLKTIIQKTFPTFFLNGQWQWQVGKSIVKSK